MKNKDEFDTKQIVRAIWGLTFVLVLFLILCIKGCI